MRPDEFVRIRELEDTHWWYQGRRHLLNRITRYLKLKDALILDAGCGTGFAGRELSVIGDVVSLDASPDAFANQSAHSSKNCLSLIDPAPFPDKTFDLISAMDIIEHLDDDNAALAEMFRICKDGGYLFISVPAYQWMWSGHDKALGHKRRYTLHDIKTKVSKSGFSVDKASYFVSSLFPAILLYRLIRNNRTGNYASSDLAPVFGPVNSILSMIMRIESSAALRIGLLFGLTAFVLARKPSVTES